MTNKKNQRIKKKNTQTGGSSSPTKSPTSAISHASSVEESTEQLLNRSNDTVSSFAVSENFNPD